MCLEAGLVTLYCPYQLQFCYDPMTLIIMEFNVLHHNVPSLSKVEIT